MSHLLKCFSDICAVVEFLGSHYPGTIKKENVIAQMLLFHCSEEFSIVFYLTCSAEIREKEMKVLLLKHMKSLEV